MATLAQLVDDVVVHKFELEGREISLGRHPQNSLVVDDTAVSSNHARLLIQANSHFPEFNEFFLEDLHSTNGTFINNVRLIGKQRLHSNDIIRVAYNKFKFLDNKEAELEKTVHMLQQSKF